MNRDEINARNYEQHCKIGTFGAIDCFEITDKVTGLIYLIELIALRLAERTKLKV